MFSVDLRSLAVLRMGLAFSILWDLCHRYPNIDAHLTDWGLLPREPFTDIVSQSYKFSLHMLSGEPWAAQLLMALAAFCALCLLVGYRTRLFVFLSWILLLSLHNRNPIILNSGDSLLRLLLFWSLFLPLGGRYSIDNALDTKREKHPNSYLSVGSVAFLLQVVFVYLFLVLQKIGTDWSAGTAVYYALSLDQMTTPLGTWLLQFPELLKGLTYFTLYFQQIAPILLLSPFATGAIRVLLVPLFISFQVGFSLCLILGVFPWVASFAMIPFLPTSFWDWLARKTKRHSVRAQYDDDCLFCKKLGLITQEFLALPKNTFRPTKSQPDLYKVMERENSWIVIDKSVLHYRYDAFICLLKASPIFGRLSFLLDHKLASIPGTALYKFIANNRGTLSNLTTPLPFRENKIRFHWSVNLLAFWLLLLTFYWNLANIPQLSYKFPSSLEKVMVTLRLDQKWKMFSPPLKKDGWYVAPGELEDGSKIDVITGLIPSFDKPQTNKAYYSHYSWQKVLMNLTSKRFSLYLPMFGDYLCRKWENHSSKLLKYEVYFVEEVTLPNYQPSEPNPVLIWDQACP